jgi:hypothetical protein
MCRRENVVRHEFFLTKIPVVRDVGATQMAAQTAAQTARETAIPTARTTTRAAEVSGARRMAETRTSRFDDRNSVRPTVPAEIQFDLFLASWDEIQSDLFSASGVEIQSDLFLASWVEIQSDLFSWTRDEIQSDLIVSAQRGHA